MYKRNKLIKSEIVDMFATSKEALRHYENVGLLKPEIGLKNYRYYGFEEMRHLRQVFVLKDLGFPLEKMKTIMAKEVSQEAFKVLLSDQNALLKQRIDRYKTIQDNISLVLKLLGDGDKALTISHKTLGGRTFLILDSDDDLLASPKAYYDKFKPLIQEAFYNERVLVTSYDYKKLDRLVAGDSKLCIDIGPGDNFGFDRGQWETKTYGGGDYLSVFYIYKTHQLHELGHIKESIDTYMQRHALVLEESQILEFEHPELGMVLKEDEELYEIQLKVRSING